MSIFLWLLAGVVAAWIATLIPFGRPSGRVPEALAAMAASIAAGVAATALDFGGWREPDWRAILFAGVCAMAVIGVTRAIRIAS